MPRDPLCAALANVRLYIATDRMESRNLLCSNELRFAKFCKLPPLQVGALRELRKDMGVRRNVLLKAVVDEVEERVYHSSIGEDAADKGEAEDEIPELQAIKSWGLGLGYSSSACSGDLAVRCCLFVLLKAIDTGTHGRHSSGGAAAARITAKSPAGLPQVLRPELQAE